MKPNRVLLAMTLACASVACAAQQAPQSPRREEASPGTYPRSQQGFQQQLEEVLKAYQAGDQANAEHLLRTFGLPRLDDWLSRRIGEERAAKMAPVYRRRFAVFAGSFSDQLKSSARLANPGLRISEFRAPIAAGSQTIGAASTEDTDLYIAQFELVDKAAVQASPSPISCYVYVDGAFRFAGNGTISAWNRPPTLRVGGDSQRSHLIHQVNPAFPPEALHQRIHGKVQVLFVVGIDGSVVELNVVAGDEVLERVVSEAVRQWRFKPFTLNGQPVEAETSLEIVFNLGGD